MAADRQGKCPAGVGGLPQLDSQLSVRDGPREHRSPGALYVRSTEPEEHGSPGQIARRCDPNGDDPDDRGGRPRRALRCDGQLRARDRWFGHPLGRSGGRMRYQLREKMFAIGDDYWIETEGGQPAFKVDGKALRIRKTLILETPEGDEVFTIQKKLVSIRDTMEIERDGETVATIAKALLTPLRDRFSIEVEGGEDMEAKGNIVDHEYKIECGGDKVAEVSKRWFRMRDTYGIEIAEAQDDALILGITVCIDQMSHNEAG